MKVITGGLERQQYDRLVLQVEATDRCSLYISSHLFSCFTFCWCPCHYWHHETVVHSIYKDSPSLTGLHIFKPCHEGCIASQHRLKTVEEISMHSKVFCFQIKFKMPLSSGHGCLTLKRIQAASPLCYESKGILNFILKQNVFWMFLKF